jgi:hypothetical protein
MNHPHWQYYLSLVDDVDRLSRFVELAESNFTAHSVECTRILLAAASEVDVVAKVLCERRAPGSKARNIEDYGNILLPAYSGLTAIEVSIPRVGLDFLPWRDWTTTTRPAWWGHYNKVKHERHNFASEGNLGNALNAVAGLCVLVSYLDYDYVSKLNVHRPFFFLSRKYDGPGKSGHSPDKLPRLQIRAHPPTPKRRFDTETRNPVAGSASHASPIRSRLSLRSIANDLPCSMPCVMSCRARISICAQFQPNNRSTAAYPFPRVPRRNARTPRPHPISPATIAPLALRATYSGLQIPIWFTPICRDGKCPGAR